MYERLALVAMLLLSAGPAFAYTIHGKHASLIKCDYEWSSVRGESGYTGYYEVRDEIWTVYFGKDRCKN